MLWTKLILIIIFIFLSSFAMAGDEKCECEGVGELVDVFRTQNQLISAGHKEYVQALHSAASSAGLPEAVSGIKQVVNAIPDAFAKVDAVLGGVKGNKDDIVKIGDRLGKVESGFSSIAAVQKKQSETTDNIVYWLITISVGVFFTLLSALGILLIMLIKTLRGK